MEILLIFTSSLSILQEVKLVLDDVRSAKKSTSKGRLNFKDDCKMMAKT
jgi:hypothetical protein